MEKKKHSFHIRARLAAEHEEEEEGPQEFSTSYVLRQNPKKSQKLVDGIKLAEISTSMDIQDDNKENVVQCRFCAKEFPSEKSLCGHMRLHSSSIKKGLFVCKNCGKEYRSAKSLYNHERSYCKSRLQNKSLVVLSEENLNLVIRKKRSCRRVLRYNTPTCSSNYSSALNNEISCSVAEFDPEMEEAAISLIMLSRGQGNWAGFKNGCTKTEDHESCVFRKKLDSRVNLGIKIFLSEKKIMRCSEFESRVLRNERVNGELQTLGSKIHELGFESSNVLCITEKDDENQQPNEKRSRDDTCSNSLDCRPIKRPKLGVCDADLADLFKCKACNKIFNSYQALGGHQTRHRTTFKPRAIDGEVDFATEIEEADCEYDDQKKLEINDEIAAEEEVTAGSESKECSIEFKCSICFKVFTSGQALGGHKRAHANKIHDTNLNSTDMLNVHIHSNDESKEC